MRLNNKISKGESAIMKVLTDLNVEFVREHKFDECRNVKKLPFDFFLPQWNLMIEFDGEHHFRYKGFWNAGRTTLEVTQANDRKKNLFCKKKGIKMIRIPFNMVDKIESIITREHSKGFPRNLNYSKRLVKKKKKNEAIAIVGTLPVLPSLQEVFNDSSYRIGAISGV